MAPKERKPARKKRNPVYTASRVNELKRLLTLEGTLDLIRERVKGSFLEAGAPMDRFPVAAEDKTRPELVEKYPGLDTARRALDSVPSWSSEEFAFDVLKDRYRSRTPTLFQLAIAAGPIVYLLDSGKLTEDGAASFGYDLGRLVERYVQAVADGANARNSRRDARSRKTTKDIKLKVLREALSPLTSGPQFPTNQEAWSYLRSVSPWDAADHGWDLNFDGDSLVVTNGERTLPIPRKSFDDLMTHLRDEMGVKRPKRAAAKQQS